MADELAPGRFEFAGWSDDVAAELTACDISCLPSRWEALPFAILESMALGRVVVASAVDGIVEEVDSGRTGVLVPSEDPASLADALDGLSSPAHRNALGSEGRRRLEHWFTAERMLAATMSVYEEAGARRGALDSVALRSSENV
jgi:glycosyltransferase involved in cell wall biosynthesis